MQHVATRHLSRDYALDYLFQESVEEQFESLRRIQQGSSRRVGLISRIIWWFRGNRETHEPYAEYWKDN